MSMIMQYIRIQADELVRLRSLLVTDPNEAYDYVDALGDDDRWRSLDTDKAWAGLSYLLDQAGHAPVDIIHGGDRLTEDEWGYGPPRLLDTKEVALAAEYLDRTPFDLLEPHFNAVAMAGIYPDGWAEPTALDYLREWYRQQRTFFVRAASMEDAIVVYLS